MDKETQKKLWIVTISVAALVFFFIWARNIDSRALENLGITVSLPLFTFIIAIMDGFNPCNLFVLTFLLALLISVSHSRKRIYTIGYIFVLMVFAIYFLFMAAWLNLFKFIGFIDPLRITIAIIALIAGIINMKELLFFRKGITLMVQDGAKPKLVQKIENMKEVIKKGTMPTLIVASIGLAAFSSLVELPCTAGFPIIYAAILTSKVLESSFAYYLYLLLYNAIYVLPLAIIIGIFGWTFKGKKISKETMEIIKFVGGLIMVALGIILLVNPGLLALS